MKDACEERGAGAVKGVKADADVVKAPVQVPTLEGAQGTSCSVSSDALKRLPLSEIQFDELETFEQTKMKPISVALAVDAHSRTILGFQVASMPAKGLLAARAREEYVKRKDDRIPALHRLMKQIKPWVGTGTEIRSDSNPVYPNLVKKHFPGQTHHLELSRKGCVTGQGELKRGRFDPLFALNHTCAMLRANLSRLLRRTWNTTKKLENLGHHLAIYQLFHNTQLTTLKAPG